MAVFKFTLSLLLVAVMFLGMTYLRLVIGYCRLREYFAKGGLDEQS